MTLVTMSDKEIGRLGVLRDVDAGRMTAGAAAAVLGITERQIYRLLKAYRRDGPSGLVSARRGKPSNRQSPEPMRNHAMRLIREYYTDFGPTLAAEKLSEVHQVEFSRETLRRWMMADGLWLDRKHRLRPVHQPRDRRPCHGELVQIDGSKHWWFEARGPQCTLLVYIDDATGQLMHLRFVASESTFDYFAATRVYLEAYGKPVAFYSDKHSVFRINRPGAVGGDGMTQFSRALNELNIDIICAHSPQAKGRVERANQTLQDRLVKELRLAEVDTVEAGNALLPAFMADFNKRFAKIPRDPTNLHRPLAETDDLTKLFAWREDRMVSNSLTLQFDNILFVLEPTEFALGLRRKRVTIADYPDGRLELSYDGVVLPYRIFDKVQRVSQAAIVENKFLGGVLEFIRDKQAKAPPRTAKKHGPRREGQLPKMFKAG